MSGVSVLGERRLGYPWIHPGDSGLFWLEGKQDCFSVRSEEERAGSLTCTRLNDYGRKGFALRDGQEPVQPHPAVVGQSVVAEAGTDIHPGDPETERGSRNRRDVRVLPNQGSQKPLEGS
jgi:hypothetical protein